MKIQLLSLLVQRISAAWRAWIHERKRRGYAAYSHRRPARKRARQLNENPARGILSHQRILRIPLTPCAMPSEVNVI